MKSKNIALMLSAVLLTNTVGFAAYAGKASDATKIDESLIDQSIAAQTNDMKRNLEQVNALIASIETYRTASQNEKQNAFVNAARLMITILGLGSAAVHMKNAKAQSSIELTLAAVAGVISTSLEKYVSSQKIDINEVKSLLSKNQVELVNSISSNMSKEDAALISGAVAQLAQINTELDSRMNDIKRTIDSGQTDLAIVAVVTLVLNYAAPFLPAKVKDIVANKAPVLLGHAAKTKKQGMQVLGTTNIATMLSTVAGLGGKDSQVQMELILSNLRVTQANLKASLK